MDLLQTTAVSFFVLALLFMFIAIAKGDVEFGNSWGMLITLSTFLSIGFAIWHFTMVAGSTIIKYS